VSNPEPTPRVPPGDSAEAQRDAGERYKSTVRLPRTEFPMKANLPALEQRLLEQWRGMDLYAEVLKKNAGRPLFVLHDGPPYANGALHLGHILNKTLKDMVAKFRNMSGYLTNFVPG